MTLHFLRSIPSLNVSDIAFYLYSKKRIELLLYGQFINDPAGADLAPPNIFGECAARD